MVVLQQVAHIGKVNSPIAILIPHLCNLHLIGYLGWFLVITVEVQQQFVAHHRRPVVAGTYQFLEPQLIETQSEILEEVALIGVIAVAEHHLVLEVRPIMMQLTLNIGELRVELILLCRLGSIEIFICHNWIDSE